MSSILKALRKVEDDKAALGEGSVDLAHDILKQNYRQSNSSFWPFALGGLLLLILLVGGVWFWIIPDQQVAQKSEQAEPQSSPTSARVVAPAATVESPVFDENLSEQTRAAAPGASSAEVASGAVVVIPLLQVEEIIYQQDPAARMAVINGLPVMEGTDIEGVRVEQIFVDRVQFVFQGVRFIKHKMSLD